VTCQGEAVIHKAHDFFVDISLFIITQGAFDIAVPGGIAGRMSL